MSSDLSVGMVTQGIGVACFVWSAGAPSKLKDLGALGFDSRGWDGWLLGSIQQTIRSVKDVSDQEEFKMWDFGDIPSEFHKIVKESGAESVHAWDRPVSGSGGGLPNQVCRT